MAQLMYPARLSQPAKQTAAMLPAHQRRRFLVVPFILLLLRRLVHLKVTLRSYSEGIRHSIEESEHRRDVNRFSDLRLGPAMISKPLYVLIGGAIGGFGHLPDVVKQGALRGTQAGRFKVALRYRLYGIFVSSLNTQEVCMRVQSIRTAIEPRYPARNRFLGFSVEVTLGKMNRVAELHHFA